MRSSAAGAGVVPRVASRNFVTGCLINGVTNACSWGAGGTGLCILDPVFISRLQPQGRLTAQSAGRSSGTGSEEVIDREREIILHP